MAKLPLRWLHRAGAVLGWMVYRLSPTYARRLDENLAASGVCADARHCAALRAAAIGEAGKGVTELVKVWFGSDADIERLVACDDFGVVDAAKREGRGLMLLTPHIGCFEIAGLYIARRLPLTVLYRPPRLGWLEPLMTAGRQRGQAQVAPATLRGVRALYKALGRGEAVGILPDQAPSAGEGVWAPFFGRPAYTMTLATRLQRSTGAAVIMVFAERLSGGRGYRLSFERIVTQDAAQGFDEAALNRAVEAVICRSPAQYLWGYNRYKAPRGAKPPPGAGAAA